MLTVNEYAETMRVSLQVDQRYTGPAVLVSAANPDKEIVVLEEDARRELDVAPTSTLQIDKAALEEQLSDYVGSISRVIELVTGDSALYEVGRRGGEKVKDVTVGRDDDNDIALADPTVSGQHARLLWQQGRWVIEDLTSSNGTYVNKKSLKPGEQVPLVIGDCVRFGDCLLYYLIGQQLGFFFKRWLPK